MSQYPPPYQPHQPYGYASPNPHEDLRGPAKRSSVLMFVLGGLMCLCGLCCLGVGPMISQAQIDPQVMAQLNQIEAEVGIAVATLFAIMGVISIVPGLILLVLGFFVRSGGMAPVVISLVFVSICLLGSLFFLGSSAIEAVGMFGGGNPAEGCGALLIPVTLTVAFGLLEVWLIQATRNASRIAAGQSQYQAQYWHYQQQQQAYQQHQQQQQPPPPSHQPPPAPPAGGQTGYPSDQNWPPPPPPPPGPS